VAKIKTFRFYLSSRSITRFVPTRFLSQQCAQQFCFHKKIYIQGVPELADQTYSAFSLVITESNSVEKKGQGITDFL
jgi:hypothetical protein